MHGLLTPASLEARIARLEGSLRRQRLIGGAALVALAVVMLSALRGPDRFGSGPAHFDPGGTAALRVDQRRSEGSRGTPGGTNHGAIMALEVDRALSTPNVALIGALLASHESGVMTGTGHAVEGFVQAGGAEASDLRAFSGQVTLFDSARVGEVAAFRTNINAHPEWRGELARAYGLYVSEIGVGRERWAVYTAGDTPSRFGGDVEIAGRLTVGGVDLLERIAELERAARR